MFLVTNCSQCMLCHAVIGEVCRAHFCEVPPKQKKWHFGMAKMAFDKR